MLKFISNTICLLKVEIALLPIGFPLNSLMKKYGGYLAFVYKVQIGLLQTMTGVIKCGDDYNLQSVKAEVI